MSLFKCPVCDKQLLLNNNQYKCEFNHTFDISRNNYVNLLQSQKRKTKQHGDEKVMINARRDFLNLTYYNKFKQTLKELVYDVQHDYVLDIGCGEGAYALNIINDIKELYGIDISKEAIIASSSLSSKMKLAVASSTKIPIIDESIDVAYCVFAPYDNNEVVRVLKKGGYFIDVYPLERHLFGLKEVLYEKPYFNEVKIKEISGMSLIKRTEIKDIIEINRNKSINDLFMMTPYYHRSPECGKRSLATISALKTEIEFGFSVYKKK